MVVTLQKECSSLLLAAIPPHRFKVAAVPSAIFPLVFRFDCEGKTAVWPGAHSEFQSVKKVDGGRYSGRARASVGVHAKIRVLLHPRHKRQIGLEASQPFFCSVS